MEIRRSYNSLTLSYDYQVIGNDEISPNQFLKTKNIVFTRPVILLINGQPTLRKDWDIVFSSTDICHFVELPRGGGDDGGSNPLQLVAMVALIVVSAYLPGAGTFAGAFLKGLFLAGGSFLMNHFFAETPPETVNPVTNEPSDIYNLNTNQNSARIGSPFAEHFGRFICYPDLIMSSYTKYIDNEQYLYVVGIIGVGEYNIENIYIADTLISSYEEISYNIISPNGSLSICPEIVYNNSVGLELSDEWIASIVSPPNVQTCKIEIDIVCPVGLNIIDSNTGDISYREVEAVFEIREIDNYGVAITDWTPLFSKVYKAASRDPIRHTIEKMVTLGAARYEIQAKRSTTKSTNPLVSDDIWVETVRAFGPEHPNYGDVTLIELKILATDQINGVMGSQISVIATRKLYPVTATGFGVVKEATRSIIDICAYIVTTDNGGQQPDSTLEFDTLYSLRIILNDRENYFDFRFTAFTSVMQACSTIAMCGRSVPFMPGGLFTLVRDKLQVSPAQIYTDDDYTENTLCLDHILRTDDDPTCVEIEYIDPITWQIETIQYYDIGGSDTHPAKVSLVGCTSRQHAYEEAAYLYKNDEKNRTTVTFITGLKGHIPKLGDMVYVASRQIDWIQTGQLAHISATVATLSEPVDFGDTVEEGKLLLTSKIGGVLGPYTVTPGDCAHSVVISLSSDIVNTIHAQGEKVTKFIFGLTIDDILRVRTLKMQPSSNNEVKLIGSIIHDEVHDDPGTVPELIIPQPECNEIIIHPPIGTDVISYIFGGHSNSEGSIQDCDEYTPDVWVNKTDIPNPGRDSLAASTINTSCYIYGGQDQDYYGGPGNLYDRELQDCDEYTLDVWICKTDMLLPARSRLAASTINNSGYIYGGGSFIDGGPSWGYIWFSYQNCDQYTPDTWICKAEMPSPSRSNLSASTIGNSGYIYGGYSGWDLPVRVLDCDEYTSDTWVSKNDMLLPTRGNLAASTIDNLGYIFGGDSTTGDVGFCDEFNPNTNIWLSKADLLTEKSSLAATEDMNSDYIFGGNIGSINLQECDRYANNAWLSKSNIPLPSRCLLAAASISTTVEPDEPIPGLEGSSYIYGGFGSARLQDCDEYTPDSWTSMTDTPLPARYSLAATTIGSSGYIFGGNVGSYPAQLDCDEYTPDVWVNKTDIPSPGRDYLTAITIGSSGYILGGYDGSNRLQDCDRYIPDTWSSRTNMPSPNRSSLAASTIGNSGYIYGGYDGVSGCLQDCDEYTPDSWVSKTDMPLPVRALLAASTINNSSYIYGGHTGQAGGYCQDCDEYTPDTWVSKTNMPNPARSKSAASTIETSGHVYGGRDDGGKFQDCDRYTPDTWLSVASLLYPYRHSLAASTI